MNTMKEMLVIVVLVVMLVPIAYATELTPASTKEKEEKWVGQTYTVCGSGREGWDINCDDDPQPRTSVSVTERKVYGENWVGNTGNYAKDFPHYQTQVLSMETADGKVLSIAYWVSFTYTGIGEILDFEFAGRHYIYQTVSGYFETRVGKCPYPDEDGDDIWPRVFWDVIAARKDIDKNGKFDVYDLITLAIAYQNILQWSSASQVNTAPPQPKLPKEQKMLTTTWAKMKMR